MQAVEVRRLRRAVRAEAHAVGEQELAGAEPLPRVGQIGGVRPDHLAVQTAPARHERELKMGLTGQFENRDRHASTSTILVRQCGTLPIHTAYTSLFILHYKS